MNKKSKKNKYWLQEINLCFKANIFRRIWLFFTNKKQGLISIMDGDKIVFQKELRGREYCFKKKFIVSFPDEEKFTTICYISQSKEEPTVIYQK